MTVQTSCSPWRLLLQSKLLPRVDVNHHHHIRQDRTQRPGEPPRRRPQQPDTERKALLLLNGMTTAGESAILAVMKPGTIILTAKIRMDGPKTVTEPLPQVLGGTALPVLSALNRGVIATKWEVAAVTVAAAAAAAVGMS